MFLIRLERNISSSKSAQKNLRNYRKSMQQKITLGNLEDLLDKHVCNNVFTPFAVLLRSQLS